MWLLKLLNPESRLMLTDGGAFVVMGSLNVVAGESWDLYITTKLSKIKMAPPTPSSALNMKNIIDMLLVLTYTNI